MSRLDEIRERWAHHREPWTHDGPIVLNLDGRSVATCEGPSGRAVVSYANAVFDARAIAHAPEDIASLLERLDWLLGELRAPGIRGLARTILAEYERQFGGTER